MVASTAFSLDQFAIFVVGRVSYIPGPGHMVPRALEVAFGAYLAADIEADFLDHFFNGKC